MIAAISIVILALVPIFNTAYYLTVLFLILVYVGLAESFDILFGYGGYLNLGHLTFFAVGGYAFAIVLQQVPWIPIAVAFVVGAIGAVAFATLIAYPFFRLHGAYFAISTLGLGLLLYYLFVNPTFDWLTKGQRGILINIQYGSGAVPAYILALVVSVFTVFYNYRLPKTKFGLALLSIKENESVARLFGINTFRTKFYAFIISAAIAGLIGAIYVYGIGYVNPSTVVGTEILVVPSIMALLGGSGIFIGPLVGVTLLMTVQEVIWTSSPYFHLFTYGIIMAVVGLFMPEGIVRQGKRFRKLFRLRKQVN